MPRRLLASLLLAAAFGSPAPLPAADRGAVVLGLLLPPDEPRAASIRRGAETAVAEANAKPGPTISLAVRGKRGPWGSDASEAALLVMDDGAQALIAPPDGAAAHLVLQVSGRTAVPVAMLCTDTSVTTASLPWAVRVAPSSLDEAQAIFRGTRAIRWLAVVPAGRAGREAAADLRKGAATERRTIAKVIESRADAPSPSNLREALSHVRPDGVLLWLDAAPAARLARALREAGFAGTVAGPMKLDPATLFALSGTAAEGVVTPTWPAPSGAERAGFEVAYRRLFGEEPDSTATLAHDAALFLIDRVRRSGGDETRRASSPSEPLRGASGPLHFDSFGNRIVPLSLVRGGGGRFVPGEEAPR